jgi:hypothetical protein
MRKLLCSVLLLCVAVSASPLLAMDMILGAKSGYFIWKPYFKEVGAAGFDQMNEGTGVLYGPVVSLLFTPDLSLSASLLTGRQSAHWQAMMDDYSATQKVTGNYSFDVTRADVDSALSYQLTDNFKMFAGYKYFYLKFKGKTTEIRTNLPGNSLAEIDVSKGDITTPFHGPALGVGFSQVLGGGYFITANISVAYMRGYFKFGSRVSYDYDGTNLVIDPPDPPQRFDMKQIGFNFEPAVGINLGEGMPIITLGFRYQYLRLQFMEGTSGPDPMPDDWLNDYLYGAFVSVMYLL